MAKSDLAIQINKIIQQKGWTQKKAAGILGIDQPKVSALKNGRLGGFSIERLLSFLRALDRDIDIVVRPKTEDVAHIQVAEAINRPRYVTRKKGTYIKSGLDLAGFMSKIFFKYWDS